MADEKTEFSSGGVRVEALSPESMENFANAMKEAPILRFREAIKSHAEVGKIPSDTVDKIDKLLRAAAGNGGCFIGCWSKAQ